MKKELPKTYNPAEYEDAIYKKWEQSGFFNPDNLNLPDTAKSYTIVLPPPNITDKLHLGHSAMLAIEDLLIRYHRMRGERALWIPGTDHAAIATQNVVEKKLLREQGKTRHDLGREEFLKRVWEFLKTTQTMILHQTRKMGASLDWSRQAFTLDEPRERAVRKLFSDMYHEGVIYRGVRVVNWCPRCQSTLADDEVEYKEEKSKLYWLKYGPFVLATARPETKLGDTAVAVYPGDKRYEKMVGKKFMIPGVLGEFEITVVADRAVDPKFGSGAIKVTPAHDFTDYEIAQRHHLPVKQVINEHGRMMANTGKYAGLTTKQAREAILADMEKMRLLDHIEDGYLHNIAVCYRCGTQIEPIPSKQWFVNMDKKLKRLGGKSLKDKAIEAAETGQIEFIPARFKKRYLDWMNNLHDWCVSRQIWFGHRIPVYYRKQEMTKSQIPISNEIPNSKSQTLNKGSGTDEEIYVGEEAPAGEGWIQDPDTLDTWFSSGTWTFSTLGWPDNFVKGKKAGDLDRFHPTQVLETGYEIITLWVSRMIIMSFFALNEIPFEKVYLHGMILDKHGKKMSKSKGNGIDPLDMIDKFGADAVRLSLLMGNTPGNDAKYSEEKIASFRNFNNKLWNVARYIITNYELRITNYEFNAGELTLADKWILEKLKNLIKAVTLDLEKYQLAQAGEKLREFTWDDLADWYLEISKFEKNKEKSQILNYVLENLLKLWHPFMPFITEAIWQEMGYDRMLMVEKWPKSDAIASFQHNKEKFEVIKQIIIAIRNARAENKIEPTRKVKAVIYAGKRKNLVAEQAEPIKALRTGIGELEVKTDGQKIAGAIYAAVGEIEIYLIGAIDSEKEKARLEKEIDNLEKAIKTAEGRLANKEFAAKAPGGVVKKEKDKLKGWREELKKFREQLGNIK
ncbi:valine--tRNA ligase [Candidatus Falkowbacteria bacterium RIFCSPLOWO2_02_FULL_45_21]|uniref:Valine--tRNA ligase n=1 Tax=Candidatus Falkowbacteria bacterium RIFCSPLOWO2_02_FULL_45_21 TaxID=1797989 RepID=A0A1F5SE18_9BACT|nr:MAG: valine--tRNA ligase [Candidatus Falkowbacteria bacterium RIFCSPLOWO2_02_FULL_45_21]